MGIEEGEAGERMGGGQERSAVAEAARVARVAYED